MRRLGSVVAVAIAPVLALAACSSSSSKSTAISKAPPPRASSSTTASALPRVHVLVTNDDGVHAPGIDALVQALRAMPMVAVTVVAPATNESGTGGKTSSDPLVASKTTTVSGYPATAIQGYPADTITWAIDGNNVTPRPDVVLSGVNNGQNIGIAVDLSGTVGAARAAAKRGIPALAVSAGVGLHPNFAGGARAAVRWLAPRVGALIERSIGASVTNLNVPTCPTGSPKPIVFVPVAPKSANPFAPVNCVAPAPAPTNDVDGFVHGYVVETDDLSPAA